MATILLMEDDPTLRGVLRSVLEARGYSVLTPLSADEAITTMQRKSARVDLLISDLLMPEMTGLALAKRLIELDADLKILIMSGFSVATQKKEAALEDRTDFMEKPFKASELLEKVAEILERTKKD